MFSEETRLALEADIRGPLFIEVGRDTKSGREVLEDFSFDRTSLSSLHKETNVSREPLHASFMFYQDSLRSISRGLHTVIAHVPLEIGKEHSAVVV